MQNAERKITVQHVLQSCKFCWERAWLRTFFCGTWSGVPKLPSQFWPHDPASRFRLLAKHRSGVQVPSQAKLFACDSRYAKTARRRFFDARETGLEPATSAVTGRRSNQIELLPQVRDKMNTGFIFSERRGRKLRLLPHNAIYFR